jgi:hypothetical protein
MRHVFRWYGSKAEDFFETSLKSVDFFSLIMWLLCDFLRLTWPLWRIAHELVIPLAILATGRIVLAL